MTASTALIVDCTAVMVVWVSVITSITGRPCAPANPFESTKTPSAITILIDRIGQILHKMSCRIWEALSLQPCRRKALGAMLGQNRVHQQVILLSVPSKHRQEQGREL